MLCRPSNEKINTTEAVAQNTNLEQFFLKYFVANASTESTKQVRTTP